MIRLDVVEGYIESVLGIPNREAENYNTYQTLLVLLRSLLSQEERSAALEILELKRG